MISRTTDPQTSFDGAAYITPKLSVRRRQFMDALGHDSLTAHEVANRVATLDNIALHDTIRKRPSELVKLGQIIITGQRICTITGQRVSVYRRTEVYDNRYELTICFETFEELAQWVLLHSDH